jgi:SAM-dependent methyltransferase
MSTFVPVNQRKQNHSDEAIAAAADYAFVVADGFISWWRAFGPIEARTAARPLAGVDVLELGPGPSLGTAVVLACAGARVTVADRFTATWDPAYHVPFYEAVLNRLTDRPGFDAEPVRQLLASASFAPQVVASHAVAAEELWRIGQRFDVVFSNATLEHVQDLQRASANLAAVTRTGGLGLHQVDLRDHRDFERPLEYLTVSAAEFTGIREAVGCECGGQWRTVDYCAAFREAGFDAEALVNLRTSAEYAADLRPRLHLEFAHYADDELSAISALFVLRRRA